MKYLARIFGEKRIYWNRDKMLYGVYYEFLGNNYYWRMAKE